MECDWCHREYTPKRVNRSGNHFCSNACKLSYNRWTRDRPLSPIVSHAPNQEVERIVVKAGKEINLISEKVVELKGISACFSALSEDPNVRLRPLCGGLSDGINELLERYGL